MSDDPYARLYLPLVDDPKFVTIYDNDHHFATYCRLLMIAEGAWPASAHIPVTARRASIAELERCGLIDRQPGGRYRIHGLDAERERRSAGASRASNARWSAARNAERIADTSETHMLAKPSQDEPSQDEHPRVDGDDLWQTYRALTRAVTLNPNVIDWLTRLEDRYTTPAVCRHLLAEFEENPNRKTLLSRTEARCERDARAAESAAAGRKRTDRVLGEMQRRRIELYRNTGQWDPAWGPEPEKGAA